MPIHSSLEMQLRRTLKAMRTSRRLDRMSARLHRVREKLEQK